MLAKVKEHPSVTRLVARYNQLPRRDQQMLKVLVVALALAILYFAVWQPVADYRKNAEAARDSASALLGWMQENRQSIRGLASAGQQSTGSSQIADGRALMATVTQTARESGLSLQRFEPSGDTAIRVWMEDVPFAQVAAWLEQLNQDYGIVIDQAAMDRRNNPGVVSVRLTLAI